MMERTQRCAGARGGFVCRGADHLLTGDPAWRAERRLSMSAATALAGAVMIAAQRYVLLAGSRCNSSQRRHSSVPRSRSASAAPTMEALAHLGIDLGLAAFAAHTEFDVFGLLLELRHLAEPELVTAASAARVTWLVRAGCPIGNGGKRRASRIPP
jgi:hypothetical protein